MVILVVVVQIRVLSSQPSEEYFKVVAAHVIMTRTTNSNWAPWYADLPNSRVQCLICGDDFARKKGRMLSHLGYVAVEGRDTNVRLCKLAKPDVFRAFRGCAGDAPAPPEPMESQHFQGSAGSEEPICQGSQSSTMHASCGAS